MSNMHVIASQCVDECERQQVELPELACLLEAYWWALETSSVSAVPSINQMCQVALLIEPVKARDYRKIPVTFADGKTAPPHTTISDNINRMWKLLDLDTDPDAFVKAFLDVHPFLDGNGRTAFILYNWLNRSLDNPVALPDFYKE